MDHFLLSIFICWWKNKNWSLYKVPMQPETEFNVSQGFFSVHIPWCFTHICGALVLFTQPFTRLSIESTKSIRSWNSWQMHIKEPISFLLLDWNSTIFNVYFSRILLTTCYNLLGIVRTQHILNNFFCKSLILHKMKVTILICLSLFQASKTLDKLWHWEAFFRQLF